DGLLLGDGEPALVGEGGPLQGGLGGLALPDAGEGPAGGERQLGAPARLQGVALLQLEQVGEQRLVAERGGQPATRAEGREPGPVGLGGAGEQRQRGGRVVEVALVDASRLREEGGRLGAATAGGGLALPAGRHGGPVHGAAGGGRGRRDAARQL